MTSEKHSESSESTTQRLFYNLLVRVGALGKYQYISLFIWGFIHMLNGSVLFFNPLLFYQEPYTCPYLTESQCLAKVCSLPIELRGQFLTESEPKYIDRFGDYRCENSNQLKYIQSIVYLVGMLGTFLITYINIYVRKKLILETALQISLLCFILMFFVKSLEMLAVVTSLNFALQLISTDLLLCFLTEIVIQQRRGSYVMVILIGFTFGCMMNGILFKFFSWQSIFIFYFIIPGILIQIGLKWYIKETPFDLVTHFPPEKAYQDFHWIAEQNGNADSHEITVDEIRAMRQAYQNNLKDKEKSNIHLLDLFRFKSLRSDIICCCVLHFFIYYSYSSPILALDQFSSDIYLNDIVFNFAALIAAIICFFTIEIIPRKKTIIYSSITSFIFIIPLYLTSSCQGQCTISNIIQTTGIFIFRILVQIMFETFFLAQNQVFPTQIRSLAIMMTAIFANLAPVIIPLVDQINENYEYFLPCTYVASAIIIIIFTKLIPQTLGVPPPEIIQELDYVTAS